MPAMFADKPAETAPTDGRVIRGWFRWPGGVGFIAVSWCDGHWTDLLGQPIPETYSLKAWDEN